VPASEYLFSVNLERPSGGGDFSEHSWRQGRMVRLPKRSVPGTLGLPSAGSEPPTAVKKTVTICSFTCVLPTSMVFKLQVEIHY
jgi:hypothetical protein